MRTVTLAELKTLTRQRANMEKSQLVGDAELISYINGSATELYDLLVEKFQSDFYFKDYTFTTVNGQDLYALPTDFYVLQGVDLQMNQRVYPLRKFNFNDRFRQDITAFYDIEGFRTNLRYRLEGNNIRFNMKPIENQSFRIWYSPVCPKLVTDADTFDGVNGWEEYIIVDAAIKCKIKEETDISELLVLKQALITRINGLAAQRDSAMPEVMTDVYKPRGWWEY